MPPEMDERCNSLFIDVVRYIYPDTAVSNYFRPPPPSLRNMTDLDDAGSMRAEGHACIGRMPYG